jgi:hypothetical protein
MPADRISEWMAFYAIKRRRAEEEKDKDKKFDSAKEKASKKEGFNKR